MYVKAAVSATKPPAKGGVLLDQFDVNLIKCRTVVFRLTEFLRIMKILEATLKRKSDTRVIIPLMNYILALCSGSTLNLSEELRGKLTDLAEFKCCKALDMVGPTTIGSLEFCLSFPDVDLDSTRYRNHVYDAELQAKLLQLSIKTIQAALQLSESKYKFCVKERNANRPTDHSGRSSLLDESTFDELIQPTELSMALDFAVLIKHIQSDTSEASFRKLNLQVLTKFTDQMNEKALRPIKSYHTSLFRFSKASSISQSKIIMNLPHWQYTMHRIYALILRILFILTISKSLLKQIYLPNKQYFMAPQTQLRSTNIYELRELLHNLDLICSDSGDLDFLVQSLNKYSSRNSSFTVQPTIISESFSKDVTPAVRKLRFYFQTIETWASQWKAIQENNTSDETLDALDKAEVQKLANEKFENDKLEHIERTKKDAAAKKRKDTTDGVITSPEAGSIKTIFRRSSLQRSRLSPISSGASSPGSLSPAKLSRSPSLNNKKVIHPGKFNANGSTLSSPLASRRGSVTESHGNARKPIREVLSPKPINGDTNETLPSPRRKRSASLQSAAPPPSNDPKTDTQRSNSLQVGATLNQEVLRKKLYQKPRSTSGNSSPTPNSSKPNGTPTPASFSSKPIQSNSPSPLRQKNHLTARLPEVHDIATLPDMDSLVLDEEKLKLVIDTKTSVEQHESTVGAIAEMDNDNQLACAPKDENSEEEFATNKEFVKKVRFTGVPPMSLNEDPRPKKRGWYKKPAVLHYPPPPPQSGVHQYRLRQEGLTFQSTLREKDPDAMQKRSSLLVATESPAVSSYKFSSKLRDKLIR
ncbi:LADA_0F07624g1_1 [Lachancea dasiensis]|uniref:LADA_0F07624g1_1 n=1 Tax=Lachancea dasiensis TaxID=1072105 RepID=A0A1G4JKV8_9SACH|nr:LADA_0F07624g1_1 [Lachancea dasiensis]